MEPTPLSIDGGPLALDDVIEVARGNRRVALGSEAVRRIESARDHVEKRIAGGATMYGINTGFGSLSRVRIDDDGLRDLQRNLVRSHAAGIGPALPPETVRAMMVILAASLARGRSGIRVATVQAIVDLLNRGITPLVPCRGSVGASGDLAPLAHLALSLIGEGRCMYGGSVEHTARVLLVTGLRPVQLEAKEGLALINGTHFMCAAAALALDDLRRTMDAAIVATAMAIDACRATDAFLDDRLHAARAQPGPRRVAERVRQALAGSTIVGSHKENDPRVQDPYCLRAAPQVLGAAFDAIAYLGNAVAAELGGVTDNPLVFADGADDERAILSGGNFHGMPLAIPMDAAKIAVCHIAGIAERRVNWLLTASDSENPITAYLSPKPGLHSGLMIAQYTAAACCNEMQTLAHPASVHNITTSAGIEDYNSFGATSALQLVQAADLCRQVVAIEFLAMAEALEYQRPLQSGTTVERAHTAIRGVVPKLVADRSPAPDIAAIAALVKGGKLGDGLAREA